MSHKSNVSLHVLCISIILSMTPTLFNTDCRHIFVFFVVVVGEDLKFINIRFSISHKLWFQNYLFFFCYFAIIVSFYDLFAQVLIWQMAKMFAQHKRTSTRRAMWQHGKWPPLSLSLHLSQEFYMPIKVLLIITYSNWKFFSGEQNIRQWKCFHQICIGHWRRLVYVYQPIFRVRADQVMYTKEEKTWFEAIVNISLI